MAALQAKMDALDWKLEAFGHTKKHPEVAVACSVVREACCVPTVAVLGPSRRAEVCWARHVAMWLLKSTGKLTLTQIGEAFGRCDHGTALHSCNKVERIMETEPRRAAEVAKMKAAFDRKLKERKV